MRRQLAPEDQTLLFRIVGFYEYLNALQNFDQLMQQTDGSEREVIDEIIRDHDEFVVYTNLSRRVESTPNAMSERPREANDRFERRGLAWVMALARVEVGAMLAGFTKVRSPFAAVRPTRYEMPAYRELLADGARTHYFALANDPQLREVIKNSATKPGSATVAYVRRISVAREFLNASGQALQGSENPSLERRSTKLRRGRGTATGAAARRLASASARWPTGSYPSTVESKQASAQAFAPVQTSSAASDQIAQLRIWQTGLQRLQRGLTNSINNYLAREQRHSLTRTGPGSDQATRIGAYCSAQLAGERYELQKGLARVETADLD